MTNALTVTAPEGLPFIDFTREFDAPVTAVFEAHRDPDLFRQWMSGDGYDMDLERHEFESGGRWRYVHRGPDGAAYAFHGMFHTVRENEFAIQTFEFEGQPDVVSIESMTFTDLGDGRTRLEGHAVYPTLEARDGMVSSGMEQGMSSGYTKLEELLSSVKAS
jgi:uncharacterized protein YndB with AHSA1/START domain